jgi:predicted DNA-binding ribbon-helix-helix protein
MLRTRLKSVIYRGMSTGFTLIKEKWYEIENIKRRSINHLIKITESGMSRYFNHWHEWTKEFKTVQRI